MQPVRERRAETNETEMVMRVLAEARRDPDHTGRVDEDEWFDAGEQAWEATAMIDIRTVDQPPPKPRWPAYAAVVLAGAVVGFALVRILA